MRCAARSAAARPGTGSSGRSATRTRLLSGRPFRLAYADPPYPGKARLYRDHPDYGGEVDHAALITRLAGYDGWALSTSADALPVVLALRPPGVRIAAWHRGERPTRSRWPLHAWEPVIYSGGRQLIGDRRRADSIVCGVAPLDSLPGRVIGAKPVAVCRWIFTLLGAGPGDSLDDLFPRLPGRPAGPGLPTPANSRRLRRQSTRRVRPGLTRRGRPGPTRRPRPRATVLTRRVRPWTTAICFRWKLPGDRPHRRGWPASARAGSCLTLICLSGVSAETPGSSVTSRVRSPGTFHVCSLSCGHSHA